MNPPFAVPPPARAPLRLDPGPRGDRYSLDAFLLADFASVLEGALVADLGAGCGVVGLLLAFRNPGLRVVGIELQEGLLRVAAANARQSGLAGRVGFVRADLREAAAWARAGCFAAAVINPPYRKVGTGRLSPDPRRAMARHEVTLDLCAWLAAARHLVAPGGRLFFTQLAEREEESLRQMGERGFYLRRVRRVHPSEGKPAASVLVEAARGGSGSRPEDPAEHLPPLIVYREAGLYTEEVRRMYERFGVEARGGRVARADEVRGG